MMPEFLQKKKKRKKEKRIRGQHSSQPRFQPLSGLVDAHSVIRQVVRNDERASIFQWLIAFHHSFEAENLSVIVQHFLEVLLWWSGNQPVFFILGSGLVVRKKKREKEGKKKKTISKRILAFTANEYLCNECRRWSSVLFNIYWGEFNSVTLFVVFASGGIAIVAANDQERGEDASRRRKKRRWKDLCITARNCDQRC
jgi:hypothetical protein